MKLLLLCAVLTALSCHASPWPWNTPVFTLERGQIAEYPLLTPSQSSEPLLAVDGNFNDANVWVPEEQYQTGFVEVGFLPGAPGLVEYGVNGLMPGNSYDVFIGDAVNQPIQFQLSPDVDPSPASPVGEGDCLGITGVCACWMLIARRR